MRRMILFTMVVLLSRAAGFPGNWPNWRGPNMNGVAEEKNLPVSWSTSEGITWKLPMPDFSGSTPIIWQDRIFLSVADRAELYLSCVDRDKGVEIWKKQLGSGQQIVSKNSNPRRGGFAEAKRSCDDSITAENGRSLSSTSTHPAGPRSAFLLRHVTFRLSSLSSHAFDSF